MRGWPTQAASSGDGPEEIVLIVDANRRYVAATDNAKSLFGRDPVGLCIDDVTPRPANELQSAWSAFTSQRSMEGEYDVLGAAGRLVHVRFRALADVPLPGFFVSHLVVVPADHQLGGEDGQKSIPTRDAPRPSRRALAASVDVITRRPDGRDTSQAPGFHFGGSEARDGSDSTPWLERPSLRLKPGSS